MLLSETEINTLYTCLEPIQIGQLYGPFEVDGYSRVQGLSYHFYSNYAIKTEDALDHVLRSINRDPRRGYGWWHQTWIWWCGNTYYRDLWVDDEHLDPQYGAAVFCEERAAVTNLMQVIKNCLDPQGVVDITFNYTGTKTVDVEVYTLSNWFFGGWWSWFDGFYDLEPGESFLVDGSSLAGGILTERIMMRIYDADTGKLLDTQYVRSSGEWFLEVEPGNFYGDFEILSSTLILGNGSEWDEWWGGDSSWWDWFFGFWRWGGEEYRSSSSSRCGWQPEECFDKDEAMEEQLRICSNVTLLKEAIIMLLKADDILARIAYAEAENATVQNASFNDEYMYHLKWAQRYWNRGNTEMKKGMAYNAITSFKRSWKHSILAVKWAIKEPADPDPKDSVLDPCECFDNDDCQDDFSYPWWMHWYIKYSNWGHLKKGENPEFPCEGPGLGTGCY
ncbi:MAG: hypothetical protein ACYTFW_16805 [Planctomycetota bacterium]